MFNLESIVKRFIPSPVEETPRDLHEDMHGLIQRHKALIARVKENHNLIQSMKQNEGMGRQKQYVWEEIQADRQLATDIAQQICELKIEIFGDKATNIEERVR